MKYENGLVLGKFYPYHLGHKYLIESALKQSLQVYVMVCSLENEDIPGYLRYRWIKNDYAKNSRVHVIWCRDEMPQTPDECESKDQFYNNYWVPAVYLRIKELDVVFTSESYGDEFAQYLGVEHVLVDIDRKKYSVSGTLVRNNPFEMWDYISMPVKSYFKKKIVVVGPESTGKSTMVKKLAYFFNSNYVEEYGRTYTDTVKPARNLNENDYCIIARNHAANVLKGFRSKPCDFLFVDTEAITTKLFAELYLQDFRSVYIDKIIDKQDFDLYLLLDINVPWVDDGTRDFQNQRKNHFDMIETELKLRRLPYVVVSGKSYNERVTNAISQIIKKF